MNSVTRYVLNFRHMNYLMKQQLTRGVVANKNHHSGENSVAQFSKDPCQKIFNLDTYKYHSLGDYTSTIHRFGTTNSYSTTMVCGLFCTDIVHSCLHSLPLRGILSTAHPSHVIFAWITKHLSNNWQKLSGSRSV